MVALTRVSNLDPKKRSLVALRPEVPRSPQRDCLLRVSVSYICHCCLKYLNKVAKEGGLADSWLEGIVHHGREVHHGMVAGV